MSVIPQNTTDIYTLITQEKTLTPCRGKTLLLFYPHLDEAMKGIMRLSSVLADVCQRDLQARVWIARDTGALKLRFAQVLGLYAEWLGWGALKF